MADNQPQIEDEGTISPEMQMLQNNKTGGYNYRFRRHNDWLETYDLYRDKVIYNRLTQRQSVNIPLMKQTVKSLLKDVDDMPVLYFENLDNDKQAELFKNEYWKYTVWQNRLDILDIMDKRQVFLFGRSYDQWQVIDGKVKVTIIDPMDILVPEFNEPANIHLNRFLIHTHIFIPLTSLEANEDYDQEEVKELKDWFASTQGLIKQASNVDLLSEKNKKMADQGVLDVYSPVLGETYVELTQHFIYRPKGETWFDKDGVEQTTEDEQIFLYVEAENMRILLKKPLEKIIGETQDHYWKNHYPYNSWADDLERQDWYSDATGDIVRTANKVLNTWYSQEVENRTLRSLGMKYYDNTIEGFHPQTYTPQAFGWYGLPGKPADIVQDVDIPDISSSLDSMTFILELIEKATGATPAQQGAEQEHTATLGEVQLSLGEAKERSKGMSKFYTPAWEQRGEMFIKLVEAAGDKLDAVRIYKKGLNSDNIYSREISQKDWQSALGYRVKVWSQDDKDAQDAQTLNTLGAANQLMPGNSKLIEITDRKVLELAKLQPTDINDIMLIEKQRQQQMMQAANGMGGMGLPPGAPAQPGQPGQQPGGAPGQQQMPQVPINPPATPGLAAN